LLSGEVKGCYICALKWKCGEQQPLLNPSHRLLTELALAIVNNQNFRLASHTPKGRLY
jgi:hypothetical protein